MAASATATDCPPTPAEAPLPDGADRECDPVVLNQLVADLQEQGNREKSDRETAQQAKQLDTQQQQLQSHTPQEDRSPQSSRRWSENPVNAPIFMAKKFAEKMRRTKEGATPPASEVAPSTSPALPGSSSNQAPPTPSMTQSRRKSSTSSQRRSHKNAATVPKTPPSPSSKQPSASGPTAVVQEQQQPQARSPSSVTSRESTHTSTSSKKRGKHKRKSRSSKEPEG
ncbi:hypothetical protein MTO96_006147 [Rhipicephalus appendiculatus]